jgi:esterase/lipase
MGQIMKNLTLALCVTLMLLASSARAQVAVQSGTFDSNGVKIAYIVAGQGEPVVLVHGLDSSAAMNWQLPGIFEMLAEKYRVAALDLRGHGKSDKPTEESAYGEPMVDDVVGLMDHLNMPKAQVVGYSLGGIIVMRLAVEHPDRVKAMAMGGMGWLREGGMLQRIWENARSSDSSQTPPACVHGIAKLAVSEEQIKSVKIPVEMLVGDHDPCKLLYVDPLTLVRPDWPVIVIQDAGHINCIAKPQFKDELMKWIGKNAGQ